MRRERSTKTVCVSRFEHGERTHQEYRMVKSASNVRLKLRCNCLCNHEYILLPQTRFVKKTDVMIFKWKYREENREKVPVCCCFVLCCDCSTFKIQFKVSVWLPSMYNLHQALKSPLVSYFISSEDLKNFFASPCCMSPWIMWVQSLKI